MHRRSSSTFSSGTKAVRKENDEASEMIATMLAEDARLVDAETEAKKTSTLQLRAKPTSQDAEGATRRRLEDEYIGKVVELRLELQKGQTAEESQRLRAGRDEWKQMSEHLQSRDDEGDGGGDDPKPVSAEVGPTTEAHHLEDGDILMEVHLVISPPDDPDGGADPGVLS